MKAGPDRELHDRYVARAEALAARSGFTGFQIREIAEARAKSAEARRAAEGRALLEKAEGFLCALDERGAAVSTAQWAAEIARARDAGEPCYLVVIGGPDGLDESVRRAARSQIAFGAMTWPHQLVRIMAAEQIYRGLTLLAGHPYHRA